MSPRKRPRRTWTASAHSICEGINFIEPWEDLTANEHIINLVIASMQELGREEGCPPDLKKILKELQRQGEWDVEIHEAYTSLCDYANVEPVD